MIRPKVLAVVGATASGKSSLAMKLAKRLNAEILCMDSMQIYRHMDIGTAKPTRQEQEQIPHHLLDIVEPTQEFGVADYTALAEKAITDVTARGKLPMLVGGTGLYLKSLMHGLALGGAKSDPVIRARLEAIAAESEGKTELHRMLEKADPESAKRLHPNDLRRVVRALEIFELTGQPMSCQKETEQERPYEIFPIGLTMPRTVLYQRITDRVHQMIRQGLVAEVRYLLEHGVSPHLQAMQGIGYKELVDAARGTAPLAPAVEQIILNTKHYAKRQETWLKGEEKVRWLEAGEQTSGQALKLAEGFLESK